MNNDLIAGVPDLLKGLAMPTYPSIHAGWHSRLKSAHFHHTAELIREFGALIGCDPWLFSCLDTVVDEVNIHEAADRGRLAEAAAQLTGRIQAKYHEHGIDQKPFVFLKADSGTYGMGVMAIEDPNAIVDLNRRDRNQLYKGKGATVIRRYLLQEGVPSAQRVDDHVGEVCVYQVVNHLVGGFYRTHSGKTARENLNSPGMGFKTMCPHSARYGDPGVHDELTVFDAYRLLARIAGIAAMREIQQLETAVTA